MKKRISYPGYTLVELLTVIGILSVISAVVISIIFTSLTGTKKSDSVELLRQNGDTALSQIIKRIRFAKAVSTPSTCFPSATSQTLTVTQLDNSQTMYACVNNTITENTVPLVDTTSLSTTSCSFTCTQGNLSTPPTITIQFTLTKTTGGQFVESKASLPFQTSVTLRNYSR